MVVLANDPPALHEVVHVFLLYVRFEFLLDPQTSEVFQNHSNKVIQKHQSCQQVEAHKEKHTANHLLLHTVQNPIPRIPHRESEKVILGMNEIFEVRLFVQMISFADIKIFRFNKL